MITSFLMLAHVLVSVLLITLVLLQRSEWGLGSLGGGGGDALLGGAGAGNVLTRTTKWLFILFIALSLGLSVQMAGKGGVTSVVETNAPVAAPATGDAEAAPAVPGSAIPTEVPADK